MPSMGTVTGHVLRGQMLALPTHMMPVDMQDRKHCYSQAQGAVSWPSEMWA